MFDNLLAKLKLAVKSKAFWAALLAAVAGYLAGTYDLAALIQAILAALNGF